LYGSFRKVMVQSGLVRPLAMISASLLSSLFLFPDLYISIATMATNFDLLSSNGAYPFVMLLFLLLWLVNGRKPFLSAMSQQASGLHLTRYTSVGMLVVISSLAIKYYVQGWGILVLQLFLLLGFLQGCMMFALPDASKLMLRALAIYMGTASLPVMASSTALDGPISLVFTSSVVPFLKVLGYPVRQYDQAIFLSLPSGKTAPFYINAACAGPASYSIFLFLNGLMILDFNVGRRWAAGSTAAGIAALYALNILRVVLLVHTTFYHGEAAGATMHLYLGYVLFSAFYLAYVLLFAKFISPRHPPSRGP